MSPFLPSQRNRWALLASLFCALTLAGCAKEGATRDARVQNPAVARVIESAGPGFFTETARCLTMRRYQVEVVDEQVVLFHDRDEVWINELATRCTGLGGLNFAVAIDQRGAYPCQFDSIGNVERTPDFQRRGVTCPLGPFLKVSEGETPRVLEALRGRQ